MPNGRATHVRHRQAPRQWRSFTIARVSIPQHFIQELLARADVVEIVGRYVQLKKTGANFSGLCPFHSEKSPSFTVSPVKQFYHCFGCGKSGNAIGFLLDHTGAGFVEVVHDLAQQYGLTVPEDERNPAERERAAQQSAKRATLTDVLAKAADAYRKHLKAAPRAIDYLKNRGLSGQVARDFGLGYAPEGWRSLASVFADYADPLLVESGLVITGEDDQDKRYDRFRDRIMFPMPAELEDDTIEVLDENFLYSNLYEADPFGHDLDYYRAVLRRFRISVPESMFNQVQIDAVMNAGNRFVKHTADGAYSVLGS